MGAEGGDRDQCQCHPSPGDCIAVTCRITARSLLVVLGVRALLNVAGVAAGRRPLQKIITKNDLRVASFAALFSGGVRGLKCVLRRCTRLSSASTAIVSGGCAGLSFLALPKEERPTIVLFSFVRAAEFLARALSAQGSLPQCISNFAYWDVLVMCLSAMQILFSYVACPHVLDPTYLRFLQYHGAKDPRALRLIELWFRRQAWSRADVEAVSAKARLAYALDPNHFCPCELTHPGLGCWAHFFAYLLPSLLRSAKLYLPIHALYGLFLLYANRTKAVYSRSKDDLSQLTCCSTAWLMLCTTVSGFGTRSIPLGRVTQFMPGIALLFEHPARRLELALYCAPRALQGAWNELCWYGYLRPVPAADLALFSASAAVIAYCHANRREAMRGTVSNVLNWLWKE